MLATANLHCNTSAGARQHVDERINAEAVNAPTHEIGNARLGDVKESRCFSLRQLTRRDNGFHLEHAIGAKISPHDAGTRSA
ncbi:MAG TPA: hypothetical protein VN706_11980 [Gemmatimonadaceae bacterium]|nr:hypothetical protein [Gemmatimonadaceae bacterium]